MLVFRKIWRALFSWNSRFQIRTFLSVGDIHFIIIFIFCKKELILPLFYPHFNSYYWSASQSHDECNSFIKHLESNLDKATNFTPFSVVVLGDFNANFVNWHSNDKTNFEKLTQ